MPAAARIGQKGRARVACGRVRARPEADARGGDGLGGGDRGLEGRDGAPKLWGLPVETIDDSGLTPGEGAVRYSTLQRFKGLEADVVLLVDVDGSPHACSPVHLHVAASRARHRLYVFARQGVELPG